MRVLHQSVSTFCFGSTEHRTPDMIVTGSAPRIALSTGWCAPVRVETLTEYPIKAFIPSIPVDCNFRNTSLNSLLINWVIQKIILSKIRSMKWFSVLNLIYPASSMRIINCNSKVTTMATNQYLRFQTPNYPQDIRPSNNNKTSCYNEFVVSNYRFLK